MEMTLYAIAACLSLYLMFAGPICAVLFLLYRYWKKYRQWNLIDLAGVFLPGLFYGFLLETRIYKIIGSGKTLANLVEPMALGILCGVIFFLRCHLGYRQAKTHRHLSWIFFTLMMIATILIMLLVPALPE